MNSGIDSGTNSWIKITETPFQDLDCSLTMFCCKCYIHYVKYIRLLAKDDYETINQAVKRNKNESNYYILIESSRSSLSDSRNGYSLRHCY